MMLKDGTKENPITELPDASGQKKKLTVSVPSVKDRDPVLKITPRELLSTNGRRLSRIFYDSSNLKKEDVDKELLSPKQHHNSLSFQASDTIMKQIHEILCCSLCKNIMKAPIYSCQNNNHIICSTCSPVICPICSETVTKNRHPAMEAIAELVFRPCKYMMDGCTFESSLDLLRSHEKLCSWKPLSCMKCSWSSDLRIEHVKHMKEVHGYETEEVTLKKPFRIDLTESGDNETIVCNRMLELRSGEIFFLESEKRSCSFFFIVRFIPRTDKVYEKSKYDRSILLANDEWKNRKLVWHGFATKISQDGMYMQTSGSSSSVSDNQSCVTKLERCKRVSDSSWELVWNVKKLSVHGYVNVTD